MQDMDRLQASGKCQLMVSLPITSSSSQGLMPAAAVSPKQASAVISGGPLDLEGQPYTQPRQHAAGQGHLGIGALSAGVSSANAQLPSGYALPHNGAQYAAAFTVTSAWDGKIALLCARSAGKSCFSGASTTAMCRQLHFRHCMPRFVCDVSGTHAEYFCKHTSADSTDPSEGACLLILWHGNCL